MYSFDFFYSYLKLGFDHIADLNGFDHLLFIITLCAVYQLNEWKKIAIVITAFTLGHSITLALAALKIILPNRYLIELLIPVTILISATFNLVYLFTKRNVSKQYAKYFLALFFGLIHGMGFSNFFTDIMGNASKIIFPLFSFNVGVELGQLFIIFLYFVFVNLLIKVSKIKFSHTAWFFSVLGIFVSLYLIITRI